MIERQPLSDAHVVLGRYTHPESAQPARLDRLVSNVFEAYPTRASARKACERGEFAVGSWVSESCRWVLPGDELLWIASPSMKEPVKQLQQQIPVLFEDEWLAVVNKPGGMPTSGHWARTLEKTLPFNLTLSPHPDVLPTPRPVHRLDAPTSGLVIVAKTRTAHAALGQAFEGRRVWKQYRAIVIGQLDGAGTVELPIEGRQASSRYVAVCHSHALRTGFITTVDLLPETGRTHQLRIHLASLGHPVLGDTVYGAEGSTLFGKGLFLAAVNVRFEHPADGRVIDVAIDEPLKFSSFRAREERRYLRWHGERKATAESLEAESASVQIQNPGSFSLTVSNGPTTVKS